MWAALKEYPYGSFAMINSANLIQYKKLPNHYWLLHNNTFLEVITELYLSPTHKISAIWLVNEAAIYRIFEGGIFFEHLIGCQRKSLWFSLLRLYSFLVAPFCWSRCWLWELSIFLSYILCIDDKHVIVQSLKKYGICFSFF